MNALPLPRIKEEFKMKIIVIISSVLVLAIALRMLDVYTNKSKLKSIGASSNKASRNIPKVDVTDPEDLKRALDYYRDMTD